MPFRALVDGEIVVPAQIDDHQAAVCPECGGVLYPRDGTHRARHFYHVSGGADNSCSMAGGGESETHSRCTALAVESLERQFADLTRIGAEVSLDVSETETSPETRRADALIEFGSENPYFGRGLIVEVQHKHHSKDIEGTTHDYLAVGFSVVWLTPDDFGEETLSYDTIESAFQSDEEPAYSTREYDCWEFETSVSTNLEWQAPDRECFEFKTKGKHRWERIPAYAHPNGYEYEFCVYCELRRTYNQELGRYVYDSEGTLAPDLPRKIEDAKISDPEYGRTDELTTSLDDPVAFEEAIALRPDVAPCKGPRGIHQWQRKEIISRNAIDKIEVELWNCRHCPMWILVNFSGKGETESHILFGEKPDPDWGLSHLNGNPRLCQHRCHQVDDEFDYCPSCFQSPVASQTGYDGWRNSF